MVSENPYESPSAASPPPRTRSTRWLVWSGVACLGLAEGISLGTIPSFAAVNLGLIGTVLLIAGLVIRRPVK